MLSYTLDLTRVSWYSIHLQIEIFVRHWMSFLNINSQCYQNMALANTDKILNDGWAMV